MRARNLLESNPIPVTINGGQTIYDAMSSMIERKVGSLIVTDQRENPIGIITESDVLNLAFRYRSEMMDLKVKENMSTDLILGVLDDEIEFIASVMIENRIQHIPIMDDNEKLCGIISARDIVRAGLMQSARQE